MSDRLPWAKWTWAHWENDEALALCSMPAQGFWMRLLCIAAKEGGFVLVAGKPPPAEDLAVITRQKVEDVETWLAELERRGVFSRDGKGAIYSRRIVRDGKIARRNQRNGKLGGNPKLGKDKGNPDWDNPPRNPPVKADKESELELEEDKPPTPLKGGEQDSLGDDGAQPAEPPGGRRKPKRALPDHFPSVDDIAAEQAKARAVGANVDMAYQAQRFRNWAQGADHRYADWPKTWQNWCLKTVREAPKTAPVKSAVAVDPNERWRRSMRRFKASQYWNTTDDGPQPGKPNCQVPAQILAEFGIEAPSGDLLPFPVRSDAA